MTGTPSERAALLSAAFRDEHRFRRDHGRPSPIQVGVYCTDEEAAFLSVGLRGTQLAERFRAVIDSPFYRLGLELRSLLAADREISP